jgi:phage-related protein
MIHAIEEGKPLVWLHGEIKSPPFTAAARIEVGMLLRLLQNGEYVGMPHSRPMPRIASDCHELRLDDGGSAWRIVYAFEPDAILILAVFAKKTRETPDSIIAMCQRRLAAYRRLCQQEQHDESIQGKASR